MEHPTEFNLTEQHIKLVREMYIHFNDDSYEGAPAASFKRPYGNSDVAGDVADILGIEYDEDEGVPEELYKEMMALHRETGIALQIIVNTGSFEPGLYHRPVKYDTRKWVKK